MTKHTPSPPDNPDSIYWQRAIDSELTTLAAVPPHNHHHPRSELFASLLRLASLAKSAGMGEGELIPVVVQTCAAWDAQWHGRAKLTEWVRMWRNAWKYAQVRAHVPGTPQGRIEGGR